MTVVGDSSIRGGIKTVVHGAACQELQAESWMRAESQIVREPTSLSAFRSSTELDLHAFAPRDIASRRRRLHRRGRRRGWREVRLVHGRGARRAARHRSGRARSPARACVEFWDDAALAPRRDDRAVVLRLGYSKNRALHHPGDPRHHDHRDLDADQPRDDRPAERRELASSTSATGHRRAGHGGTWCRTARVREARAAES